jgi:hypothetical protein
VPKRIERAKVGERVDMGPCGSWADLRVTRVGGTPVILLRQNGRDIAPDREVLRELTWMPAMTSGDCAFSIR